MKWLSALLACAVLTACDKPAGVELEVAKCTEDEFGMGGCTDIVGRVVTNSDQPVAGAYTLTRHGTLSSSIVTTDGDGHFRLRVSCILGCPAAGDSVWIRAFVLNRPNWPGSTIESVAVRPRFAPLGEVPDSTVAIIRFPQQP